MIGTLTGAESAERGQVYFFLQGRLDADYLGGLEMPRKARVIDPGMPHHIVQRGHNRNVVFVEDLDYEYYLENLAEWKTAFKKLICPLLDPFATKLRGAGPS